MQHRLQTAGRVTMKTNNLEIVQNPPAGEVELHHCGYKADCRAKLCRNPATFIARRTQRAVDPRRRGTSETRISQVTGESDASSGHNSELCETHLGYSITNHP
jgi:hypothetical protein